MFYIFTYSYKPPSTAAMVVAGRLPLKRQMGFFAAASVLVLVGLGFTVLLMLVLLEAEIRFLILF